MYTYDSQIEQCMKNTTRDHMEWSVNNCFYCCYMEKQILSKFLRLETAPQLIQYFIPRVWHTVGAQNCK